MKIDFPRSETDERAEKTSRKGGRKGKFPRELSDGGDGDKFETSLLFLLLID